MKFLQEDDQTFVVFGHTKHPLLRLTYPNPEVLGEYLPHLFKRLLEKDSAYFSVVGLDDSSFLLYTNSEGTEIQANLAELRNDDVGLTLPVPIPGVSARSAFPLVTAKLIDGDMRLELHHYNDPFLDITQTLLGHFYNVLEGSMTSIQ